MKNFLLKKIIISSTWKFSFFLLFNFERGSSVTDFITFLSKQKENKVPPLSFSFHFFFMFNVYGYCKKNFCIEIFRCLEIRIFFTFEMISFFFFYYLFWFDFEKKFFILSWEWYFFWYVSNEIRRINIFVIKTKTKRNEIKISLIKIHFKCKHVLYESFVVKVKVVYISI